MEESLPRKRQQSSRRALRGGSNKQILLVFLVVFEWLDTK